MKRHHTRRSLGLAADASLIATAGASAQHDHRMETPVKASEIRVPESIRLEHEKIHTELVRATKLSGPVGAAARELANVLHPHFVREEQIALPPLGLLEPLASGKPVPDAILKQVLSMADSLRAELPRMLEEHKAIRAAVAKLEAAAMAETSEKARDLARELAAHAVTEEEILYPTALL